VLQPPLDAPRAADRIKGREQIQGSGMRQTMIDWRFLASTFDGGPWMRPVEGKLKEFPLMIGVVHVWEQKWGPLLGTVEVTDPRHHRRFQARIYEIRGKDSSVARFAAAEFSNGVWGFHVPGSSEPE